MSEVGLREFKDKVSSYLDRVAAGEVLTVTKRGRPVATVIPAGVSPRMARLLAGGDVRWSGRRPLVPEPVTLRGEGKSAADYVSEGRR